MWFDAAGQSKSLRIDAASCVARTLLIVTLPWLAACAAFDIDTDYQLKPDERLGVLAVGLSAGADVSNFSWYIRGQGSRTEPGEGWAINFWTWRNPLTWNDPQGRLAIIELPTGAYEFFDWGDVDQLSPASYFAIPFSIYPGRVTYLGRLHLNVNREAQRYELHTSSHLEEDAVGIQAKIPGLKADEIIEQAAVLQPCPYTDCSKPKRSRMPLFIFVYIP